MSQPRILISSGLLGGGVKTHLLHLLGVLKSAGAAVTLAAAANDWPSDDVRAARQNARVLIPSPLGQRFSPLAKLEAVATWPLRLSRDFDTLLALGFSRLHMRMKRFVGPGGFTIYDEPVDAPLPGSLAERLLTAMDGVIAMSEIIAAQLRPRTNGRPVRALPYLINGGPTPPPAPRPPVGRRELRVAFLGRLTDNKRPQWLVENWARILALESVVPARLDVYGPDVGDGLLDRLRDYVRTTGIASVCAIRGPYPADALPGILAETDVVVLPSRWEGLPLVLTEAMIRGIPIVATAAGGTAELANPDVEVVGTDIDEFPPALSRLAARLRAGRIDAVRLWDFAERRYGYESVAAGWTQALLKPRQFFAAGDRAAAFPATSVATSFDGR